MSETLRTSSQMAAIAAQAGEECKELILTLSTGAVVKVIPPKTKVLYKLYTANPEPKPPIVDIEVGGKWVRTEHPDDPDYIALKEEWNRRTYESFVKLLIITSVSIVTLPKDTVPFEQDTEWLEEFSAIGLPTTFINDKERWLEWFFYRVAVTQDDITALQAASAKLQGVEEEQVQRATESTFQDNN